MGIFHVDPFPVVPDTRLCLDVEIAFMLGCPGRAVAADNCHDICASNNQQTLDQTRPPQTLFQDGTCCAKCSAYNTESNRQLFNTYPPSEVGFSWTFKMFEFLPPKGVKTKQKHIQR